MKKTLIAILALLAVPHVANAADPTGTWRFDEQSFENSLNKLLDEMLAEMPADMRGQMEGMMRGMFEGMTDRTSGTATFKADGSVDFRSDDGEQEQGNWESIGADMIRVTLPDQPGEAIEATIDGDVMVSKIDDPDSELSFELIWHRE